MTAGRSHSQPISIATNNGDIGGGEVMLLNVAESLAGMGFDITVVGPSLPSALVDAARERGFATVILDATSRLDYLLALRQWDRHHRTGLLWCNGLLPAVATIGRKMRVVHLHQRPVGKLRVLAEMAKWRALATVVPSADMASVIRGSRVLHNWVNPVTPVKHRLDPAKLTSEVRIGFLGRPSTAKGVEVLCEAISELRRDSDKEFRLILAGESHFVDAESSSNVDRALARLGDSVERTGWIIPAEFFGQVDVLVCPSIWPESFGLVVAEALSAKVPVVVSDAGAFPEVVGPDHPWIAKSGDAADLASRIALALEVDEMSLQRSFERWERMFSPSAGAHNLENLLMDIRYARFTKEG